MHSRGSRISNNSPKRLTSFLMDQVQADLNTNLLSGPRGETRLEPRVMEILGLLAESAGQVVLREDMLDEHGSDEGITRAISILRKAFKKVGNDDQFIETIPKRGYRLVVPVVDSEQEFTQSQDDVIPDTNYLASLAVLPFLDLSENQDQGYLSEGVSVEIINALARLSFLRVSGRTSSFSFKDSDTSLREIARTLNVSHVLEGSVRKQGERLRITAQLIDAKNDQNIWSETFDGLRDDVFDFQEKIARSVEYTLQELFSVKPEQEAPQMRLAQRLTESKEAYNEFLVGRHLMYELSGQRTIPRAITAFELAVDADPNFASAWAHLAIANFTLPEYSNTDSWLEHIDTAREQTEHALSLRQDVAWSHRAKAGILSYDLKFDEAVATYQKALSLEPNDPELLFTNGYIMAALGLHEKAQAMMSDALSREPLLGPWYGALGTTHFASGDIDTAGELFLKSFNCNWGYGAILYAQLLAHQGRSKEALMFMQESYDGLGPVMQAQLKSSFVRKLTYSAFFTRSKLARKMMDFILTKRMNDPKTQPSLGTIIGFILIGRPQKFFQHVLEKPNPYVGFALSRMWEPTEESKAVRTHPDFPKFAESIGLVRAWQRYGWPETITPIQGTDGSNGQFTCK